MANNEPLQINAEVSTPNGKGVVQGYSVDDGQLIVRHILKKMTGTEAGKCITPAVLKTPDDPKKVVYHSGLWVYSRWEIIEIQNEKGSRNE